MASASHCSRRLASALLAYHREAQGIAHNASNRVLNCEIRRRRHIARAFGGDVFRADPAPS
ncbi:MAG: hypothetical protein Q7W02_09410 [Candidatus Rokubacteria bacterium]|nr:hypothetical protein [Candidatus Rokubacteria bacterium]